MLDPEAGLLGRPATSRPSSARTPGIAGKTKHLEGVEAPGDGTLLVHLTAPDFTILNALAQPMTAPGAERGGQSGSATPSSARRRSAAARSGSSRTTAPRRPPVRTNPTTTCTRGCPTWRRSVPLGRGPADPAAPAGERRRRHASATGMPPTQAGAGAGHADAACAGQAAAVARQHLADDVPEDSRLFRNQTVRQAHELGDQPGSDRPGHLRHLYALGGAVPQGRSPTSSRPSRRTATTRRSARQMLAEAGYANGFSVTLTVGTADPYPGRSPRSCSSSSPPSGCT